MRRSEPRISPQPTERVLQRAGTGSHSRLCQAVESLELTARGIIKETLISLWAESARYWLTQLARERSQADFRAGRFSLIIAGRAT